MAQPLTSIVKNSGTDQITLCDPTSLSSLRGLDTREEVYECVSTGTSALHSLKGRSIERQVES